MIQDILDRELKKKGAIEYLKPTLSREDLRGVLECLVDENLSTGQIVEKFEKLFASTFRFKYTLSVNSLTSAYHCALKALGVGENDAVLLSDIAPMAALDAIFLLRARPILVDIGKNSFHVDKEGFQRALESVRPKVVILDHTFGCLWDAKDYPIPEGCSLLEDFSEAIGVESEIHPVGKQGTIAICSLYVDSIITTGNGAMIVSSDKNCMDAVRAMIFGRSNTRLTDEPKFDYNLIDYQAALGIEQLSKLGVLLERKRKIGLTYIQAVQGSQVETYFKNPAVDTFNRFPIIVPSKDYESVKRYFDSIHIETVHVVPEPLHSVLEENKSQFPNSERLFQRGHCIPLYPNLTKDNIHRISTAIRRIY